MKHLVVAGLLVALAGPASADLVTRTSPHSVAGTADRLVAAIEGAGATVVARVDHAAAAGSVDMTLRPTVMVMFGNPKLGTPVMQTAQAAGLDLPLRVVIWEDGSGAVTLAYHDPMDLTTLGVPADTPALQAMSGALERLTGAAVAQ